LAASTVRTATAGFWLAKVLPTAMGESTSHYLVTHVDSVLASPPRGTVTKYREHWQTRSVDLRAYLAVIDASIRLL
jgi:hypothetical protein